MSFERTFLKIRTIGLNLFFRGLMFCRKIFRMTKRVISDSCSIGPEKAHACHMAFIGYTLELVITPIFKSNNDVRISAIAISLN